MDHSAHSQPPPGSEEEQEDQSSDENKRQKELDNILQEELPELQQGEFTAEILGGLFLLKLKGYQDKATAFETLKNPKLAENLFDFEHPENLQQARSSVRIADKELRKKESVNKGRAETRFLFWKQDLTREQFRKAVFTTAVARRADRIVNTEERNIRFRNAVKIYGISDETLFNTSVQQWLKNNPGRSLDDAYATVGAQITNLDKGGSKKKKRELEEEQKKARGQAIINKKEEIERGKKIATGFQDGTRDTTLRNLSEGFEFTEKGISQKQLGRGFSEIPSDLADEIMGRTPTPVKQPITPQPQPTALPARPIQQPIISKIPSKFSLPSLNPLGIFKPIPTSSLLGKIDNFLRVSTLNINRQIFNSIKNLGSTLKIGLGKIGSKIISKIGSKAIGAAIGQALGSLLPGIGNAAAALLSALGLDDLILRFAFQAALFAVLVVVGVFVFIIIGTDSLFSTNTASNPITINTTAQSSTQKYSWKEFEEKYLTTAYSP